MDKKRVIYVTHVDPSAIGHGGMHRSYQVLYEPEQIIGKGQVLLFTKSSLLAQSRTDRAVKPAVPVVGRLREWVSFRSGTVKRSIRNPYRLIHPTQFATGLHPAIQNYYEREVKNLAGAAICIIDHAEYGDLIAVNQNHNIPTISCTQNLDAFSQNFELLARNVTSKTNGSRDKQKAGFYATIMEFANELQILSRCDERLFISKLEAGLVGGIGLTAHYYPYVPVGDIRERLNSIRNKRRESGREAGLFLLIGTASYGPIRESCMWFIQQARAYGLPPDVRVLVVGLGTDTLLAPGDSIPGVKLLGWIEQEEMDELLVKATAVLIPQRFGFGALTRLSEFSCVGLPMIGDRHPTFAIDPPPGFHVVDPSWTSWYKQIEELKREDTGPAAEDYNKWESAQPKPFTDVIKMLS